MSTSQIGTSARETIMGVAAREYANFADHVWLACAHRGPLQRSAGGEADEAVAFKLHPWR